MPTDSNSGSSGQQRVDVSQFAEMEKNVQGGLTHSTAVITREGDERKIESYKRVGKGQGGSITFGMASIIQEPKKFEGEKTLHFDTNSAQISDSYQQQIADMVQHIKDKPNARIELSGHTDRVGSGASNQALSERRAEAVREKLIEELAKNGIEHPDERVIIKSSAKGESQNAVKTADGVESAANRRVEVDFNYTALNRNAVTNYQLDNNSNKNVTFECDISDEALAKRGATKDKVKHSTANIILDPNIKEPVNLTISHLNDKNKDNISVMVADDGKPHTYAFVEKGSKIHALVDGKTVAIIGVQGEDGITTKDLNIGVAKASGGAEVMAMNKTYRPEAPAINSEPDAPLYAKAKDAPVKQDRSAASPSDVALDNTAALAALVQKMAEGQKLDNVVSSNKAVGVQKKSVEVGIN